MYASLRAVGGSTILTVRFASAVRLVVVSMMPHVKVSCVARAQAGRVRSVCRGQRRQHNAPAAATLFEPAHTLVSVAGAMLSGAL